MKGYYSQSLLDKIYEMTEQAQCSSYIDNDLYSKYEVKRGLRDVDGRGVVCGLTHISDIVASRIDENGVPHSCEGELYYRGYSIRELVNGFVAEKRHGFEEVIYLLVFGDLPDKPRLKNFEKILTHLRVLPRFFVRDVLMKAPSSDMMNALSRGVLSLYPYDEDADGISMPNILKQVLQLIAQFPLLAVYGYKIFNHYHSGGSLVIHNPQKNYSTAENILHMLRDDSSFTPLEAQILDLCLILHAEHGGGNNSTFTTHVVSSSGTDTYSAVAAALGSLKGPRHGGANIKVAGMFNDLKTSVKNYTDAEITNYLVRLLDKDAYDKQGLIYGMGHAVYSLSDPRADILKGFVKKLALEKNMEREYEIYEKVERLAPQIISERRRIYKGVSANVDFYSGFLYTLLGLPPEIYTSLFAVARIAGWGAHRIEELSNNGKIIRPAYISVAPHRQYMPPHKR